MKAIYSTVFLALVASVTHAGTFCQVSELSNNEIHVHNLPKTVSTHDARYSLTESNLEAATPIKVDIVFFYQPSYFAKHGAYEGHKRIETFVKTTNESYAKHGYDYQLSISDILPVVSVADDLPYLTVVDENGRPLIYGANYFYSVSALNPGNPEYEAYKEKWKGDLVTFIREHRDNDTILGLASMGGEYSSFLDENHKPENQTTFAHEIGHNLGMNHEEGKAITGPEYARAWMCGGKRTIMYSSSPIIDEPSHYSSPYLFNNGEKCGDEKAANNARILEDNFVATSQRRAGVEVNGTVKFSQSTFTGNEDDGVKITLQRDGDLTLEASVKVFAENGTATWGTDFVDAFVLAQFPAGAATTEIIFPVIKDSEKEETETFTVYMKYPYRLAVSDDSTVTVSLTDNKKVGLPGLFSISGPSQLNEGESAEYVITRTGGEGDVIIDVKAVTGSAFTGTDFVELNSKLVFAQGEVQKVVTLKVIDDISPETKEHFTIEISSPNTGAEFDQKSVTVSIPENDSDKVQANVGKFSLSVSGATYTESLATYLLTITRTEGFEGRANLRLKTIEGTALSGIDFVPLDKEVTFIDGQTELKVSSGLLDDTNDEVGDSTFDVVLEGAGVEILTSSVTITLIDNDDPKVIEPKAPEKKSGGSLYWLLLSFALVLIKRK